MDDEPAHPRATSVAKRFDDALWVGSRMAEILPHSDSPHLRQAAQRVAIYFEHAAVRTKR
jgi:hypothetical protein